MEGFQRGVRVRLLALGSYPLHQLPLHLLRQPLEPRFRSGVGLHVHIMFRTYGISNCDGGRWRRAKMWSVRSHGRRGSGGRAVISPDHSAQRSENAVHCRRRLENQPSALSRGCVGCSRSVRCRRRAGSRRRRGKVRSWDAW